MNHEYQNKWLGQAGLQLTQALDEVWPFQYEVVVGHAVLDGMAYVYIRAVNPPNLAEIGNVNAEQDEYPYRLNIAFTWPEEDLLRYLDSPPEVQINMLVGVRHQFQVDVRQLGHAEAFFPAGRQKQNRPFFIQLDNFDQ